MIRRPVATDLRIAVGAAVLMALSLSLPAAAPATAMVLEGEGTDGVSRLANGRAAPVPDGDGADRVAVPVLAWPVAGRIVTGWNEPAGPYAAGHRGVDLAVTGDQRVTAMGLGVVGWAGMVAGTAWISVDHAGGMRTTVGPMATIVVTSGDAVTIGTPVGTASGVAHAGDADAVAGSLHVSVRIDGIYVDPTSLVGRLVPTLLPPLD